MSGTVERLSADDYQLSMTIGVYATDLFELGEPPIGVPQGNFFVALPQDIGASSPLIQTPEFSSFALLALGLIPLWGLLTRKPKILQDFKPSLSSTR